MSVIILQPRENSQEKVCTKAISKFIIRNSAKYTNWYSDLTLAGFSSLPDPETLRTTIYSNSMFVLAGLDYTDKRLPDNSILWSKIILRLNAMPECDIYIFEHIIEDQAFDPVSFLVRSVPNSLLSKTIVRLADKLVKCYNSKFILHDLKTNQYYQCTY